MLEGKQVHNWLRPVSVAYAPGQVTPLLDEVAEGLLASFKRLGHTVEPEPRVGTAIVLTTALVGKPLSWREALMLTARRRWRLRRTPMLITMLSITPAQLETYLEHFRNALAKEPIDPADFDFPGMTSRAYHTLVEQGRRGGPLLSAIRMFQAQTKCVRVMLVVGEEKPLGAYLFDLVGAYPWVPADRAADFYDDLVIRMATNANTHEVNKHEATGEPLTAKEWAAIESPAAMRHASRELAKRHFFTRMVQVNELAKMPAVHDAIKSQYSEGCFATWDPILGVLVSTITGSARPVEKENLTEDDLVVITGVRPDGLGALIREVESKRNDPPSTEAVEMMEIDAALPRVTLGPAWDMAAGRTVPVIRAKLHGHRGVGAYDPRFVELVHLDQAFYDYPVTCGSDAQARGLKQAFSRAVSLTNPADPRQVAFAILPGHGAVIVEKWVGGKAPFQVILDYMDARYLEIANLIPQGRVVFAPGLDGRMRVQDEATAARAMASGGQ